MDLRGRFSRKHGDDETDDRGRSHKQQASRRHAADDGKTESLDAPGFPPLSPQTSATVGGLSKQTSKSLSRHRNGRADERLDERRGLAHKFNIFRPHSANASRNSSADTSSSSLVSLPEQAQAQAQAHAHHDDDSEASANYSHLTAAAASQNPSVPRGSEQNHHGGGPPPLSPLSEVPPLPASSGRAAAGTRRDGFPVYPDQSYAVLQNQVHPVLRHPPSHTLRTRSSYPSHYHLSSISTESTWNPDFQDFSQSSRTAGNTPISSPGLFSSHSSHSSASFPLRESYLHPTHLQEPKETHSVEVDRDMLTGNKLINEYEVLDELGRGEHGKVKLGRDLQTGHKVAIKIVQRYSKRRRLGKLGNPEDKVKKEVAILKKARHPNVVSLLEVIDDPNRQKVYIVLEYIENGEIIWRKRGMKEIVAVDKKRLSREMRGIPDSPSFVEESQQFVMRSQLHRHRRHAAYKRRRRSETGSLSQQQSGIPAWSLEHGDISDDEEYPTSHPTALGPATERASSPAPVFTPGAQVERNVGESSVLAAVEGSMYGAYASDPHFERRHSAASSTFYQSSDSDWPSDDDDMAYVPFLTMSESRCAFRDAVLGIEYLHYQGIVHRDIKPANLLVSGSHQVKISDFGVSYLGRPIRDGDEEQVGETDAKELDDGRELSKTVGTPAFYAPELCYTGDEFEATVGSVPKITGAIDVWSLGVTLYGMIFGRLPFVADDEFALFQTIVKNPVFIPSKRLKAVEPTPLSSSSSAQASTHHLPVMNSNKRTEDELAYEPIDEQLRDLLSRLLEKDPAKRATLKEIKQHAWVLDDIPDPKAWVEETDPGFQSKGKKIEVSNEEVTRAVTKMPFIQRVRSNVAKWGGNFFGRGKEGRRRAPSYAGTGAASGEGIAQSPSSSSSVTLGRDLIRELRRSSLRGDEELPRAHKRESEHPLSQSVAASPDSGPDKDYFAGADSSSAAYQGRDRDNPDPSSRPEPPERSTSTLSNAESAKTVRPRARSSDIRMQTKPGAAAAPEPPPHSSSPGSGIGGLFGGAGRKLVRSLQRSESRRERSPASSSDHGSVDSDAHGSPSIAVTNASVAGHVQSAEALRDAALATPPPKPADRETSPPLPPQSAARARHRHSISQQCVPETAADHHPPPMMEGNWQRCQGPPSRQGTTKYAAHPCAMPGQHDYLSRNSSFRTDLSMEQIETEPPARPMTSPPSAVTVSSSSADDSPSGMSYCASHPSIPSVVSGASSFSSEALHFPPPGAGTDHDKHGGSSEDVPPLLRTGDTVTARDVADAEKPHDSRAQYNSADDENEGDISDEGIVFGKKDKKRTYKPSTSSSATAS